MLRLHLTLPTPAPQTRTSSAGCFRLLLAGSLVLCMLAASAGCGSRQQPTARRAENQLLEPNSFMAPWMGNIAVSEHGAPKQVFLRDDLVFVYTDQNVIYAMTAAGGRTLWVSRDVVGPRDRLWPPLLLDALNRFGAEVERIVAFPTNNSYVVYDETGRRIHESFLEQGERAITSPSYSHQGLAYTGLADNYGGRAAKIDPTRLINPILVPRLVRSVVVGRPVVYDRDFFIADESGNVYAIRDNGDQAWPIQRFQTGGPVSANLTADEDGLYVASNDSVLYALDRGTGRMIWRYFAEVSLYEPAFPTEDHVFLPVQGRGVVAISKREGATINREPIWMAEGAVDVLSHDAQNVYLLHGGGKIVAHRKSDGEALFSTSRTDFTRFARNPSGARIVATTPSGQVVAIEPVLTRGRVGMTVRAD